MPDSPILEVLEQTPSGAARVALRPRGDSNHQDLLIEGTPAGFRMLAVLLLEMARVVEVEPGVSETGYGLVLSTEDLPQLTTWGVEAVALSCDPKRGE